MRMGIHYWDNISRTRPWLEGFAAVGSLELTNHGELASRYGEIALNSRRKWEPLGLDSKYLVHWEAADAADPGESGHADETVPSSSNMPKRRKNASECSMSCAKASTCFVSFTITSLSER